jgi:hypothetical protein
MDTISIRNFHIPDNRAQLVFSRNIADTDFSF